MAVLIRKVDYIKRDTMDEINKAIEQVNRVLWELNNRLVTVEGKDIQNLQPYGPSGFYLPGGFIIQFFSITFSGMANQGSTWVAGTTLPKQSFTFTFPKPFPHACLFLTGSGEDRINIEGSEMAVSFGASPTAVGGTAALIRIYGSSDGTETGLINILAIGN